MKIISLFNHKGGVSKTTTTFNLGWKLAELGHKTLIVDADPQCNLTSLVLDYDSIEDIGAFYRKNLGCDIVSGLSPVMTGSLSGISSGKPTETANPNLFLYCGNLGLSNIETQISVALTTSTAIPAIKNIPGSLNHLLRKTGNELNFDFIIVDMSPSVGALNQCLLMSSDYFIVPTSPDFFCVQAIESLSKVIPEWNKQMDYFRDETLDYPIPSAPPKFLGILSQKYRPKNQTPSRSFQDWIDSINQSVNEKLVPVLTKHDMIVSQKKLRKIKLESLPTQLNNDLFQDQLNEQITNLDLYNLSKIPDFNSLIAQSQKHNVPIFCLTEEQIEQNGIILQTMEESRDNFDSIFKKLAEDILVLV